MKVAIHPHLDGCITLEAETNTDVEVLGMLDVGRTASVVSISREEFCPGQPWTTQGATLAVSAKNAQWSFADADRQLGRTLRQLFSLGLGQSANYIHACAASANPEAQEALAGLFVQLKVVAQAFGVEVVEPQRRNEEVFSHGASDSGAAIVAQGGAA